jgi:hypothetical protein
MPRPALYVPENQIIKNLSTTGKEWMFPDGTEYIGKYHRYTNGAVFTEARYTTVSRELIPYQEQSSQNYDYIELKGTTNFQSPKYISPLPTGKQYKTGRYTRYFISARNTVSTAAIFEIDEAQYKLWKSNKIDRSLYIAIELPWKLTGPRFDDIFVQPKKAGVEDTNRRIVFQKNPELPGIADLLTDYIEYTIYDRSTSTEIKSLFG